MSALVVAAWAVFSTPLVGLAQPTLSYVTPGAVAPGKTTELTLHGKNLAEPVRVWTSFPASVTILPSEKKAAGQTQVRCKVRVAHDTPAGIVGVAVATPAGVSDIVYLLVDDLPSVADGAENENLASAQEVSLPVAVDGASGGTLADWFRFTGKAGSAVSCEVVANRLGWDFDPVVRVLDADGQEHLLIDDDAASGMDPRFIFAPPQDGQYFVEVRDNRYKAGGRYRLRLGDFSFATKPASIGPSSFFRIQEGDAMPCDLPCILSGAIQEPGETDHWTIRATKGNAIRLRAITRSQGSAAILSLKLTDSSGKQLAVSPVTDSDEPALTYTPPSDGDYVLVVEDLAGRGGQDFGYAVECRSGPQFSVVLKNDKNNRLRFAASPGGAFYLDVQAQRAGYDGPITLSIDSARSGWQVFNNVIAAKANETRMYVMPPADLEAAEVADLRVAGRGRAGEDALVAGVSTLVQLRAARPYFPYPPAWQEGTILVSAMSPRPAFFAISSPAVVEYDASAGQAKLAIEMERIDPKFKDTPLVVVPAGLPAGVTAEVKRGGAGVKETYELLLKGPKDASLAHETFRYFTYAELSGAGQGFYSGDVRLKVKEESAKTPAGEGP